MTQIVGRRLGRYEVQQEIGRGGMARVYRALDTLLQRPVAIKVLAPQLGLDPEFARRFEREAITAANLRHPAIVTVYDVGEQDGLRYIAMEFIRGRSMHAIISERGGLGLGYAVSMLEPVARALDYAHSQGAVHRDVKPHNIMVDVDGRVLLTDFGIAQAPETEGGERLTRTGIFMGTPEYISPEQAEARRVDGRSDLYSLGIVAYEIITGKVPFSGATPQLIVAHAQTPPPPPTFFAPHLPAEADGVLVRALAKNPQSRFASGTALVEALRIVARRNGVPLPISKQIADLATPLASSEGQSTVSLNRGPTPSAPRRPPKPRRAPPVPPVPPPVDDDQAPAPSVPPSGRRPAAPPAADEDIAPSDGGGRRRVGLPWAIAAPLLAALVLGLLFMAFNGDGILAGGQPTATSSVPSPTIPSLSSATPAPPSATAEPPSATQPAPTQPAPTQPAPTQPVVEPSGTPLPTETATATPTAIPPPPATRRPPTRTSAPPPPTETDTATPSATPEPPSATPEPPSATLEPPPPGSATPVPTLIQTVAVETTTAEPSPTLTAAASAIPPSPSPTPAPASPTATAGTTAPEAPTSAPTETASAQPSDTPTTGN